jgi:hypothetical protein
VHWEEEGSGVDESTYGFTMSGREPRFHVLVDSATCTLSTDPWPSSSTSPSARTRIA